MKVREPVPRPLDVVLAELLLSASQAFLVGVLCYLAVGMWDDRGVGFGPVAIVLAGLGAAVGGGWLFWLAGGTGWPLAAANVPTAMFLGFALVLDWQGDPLFRLQGAPIVLALAASVYGIACGVFLDSPRRWRWDQRQKPRPGSTPPRISPATRAFAAQVPRTLPRRSTATLEPAELIPPASPASPATAGAPGGADLSAAERDIAWSGRDDTDDLDDGVVGGPVEVPDDAAADAPTTAGSTPPMPTERLDQAARAGTASATLDEPASTPGGIELPTSLEPRAQRSPWAWAAPPEWNREEEDQPRGSSGRR